MTFGGLGSVTIPSGEEWVSDPADMTVVSGQNLLISIYLPESTGPATMHHAALMNTYVSGPGNHAEDDSSADFPGRRWSWYFFSGLDVVSSTAVGTIVAFGDSITDGYSSSHLMNRRYPDYLARRIAAQPGGPKLGVVNAGMANNMVLRDRGPNTNGGPSALNRFEHDALSHESVRSVILLEGVNDIMADATAAQLQEGYRQLVAKAHARGVKVYGATILPFGGFSSHTAAREAVRQELNDWIRAGNVFDGFFDFDAKVCDPNDRTKLRDVYAHGDSLHLTDAGMSALADTVDLHMINAGSFRQPAVKPCWETQTVVVDGGLVDGGGPSAVVGIVNRTARRRCRGRRSGGGQDLAVVATPDPFRSCRAQAPPSV
jgi:lysophospholipase L1-like esterase